MALIDKASLLMVPSTYEAGKLYNVLPSGNRAPDNKGGAGYDQTRADFDFDRGSNAAATRINSSGLIEKYRENLVKYSQEYGGSGSANWANVNSAVISTDNTLAPDGTLTADKFTTAAITSGVYQIVNVSSGSVYTQSVYLKNDVSTTAMFIGCDLNPSSANITFNPSNGSILTQGGSVIDSSSTDVGDGWYRVSLSFVATGTINTFVIYSTTQIADSFFAWGAQQESGLVATEYLNSTSVTAKVGVLIDMPRINYDANGENGALLLEPSRQQLIQFSEYFGAGYTLSNSAILNNNTTSPEGFQNATKIYPTSSGNYRNIRYGSLSPSTGLHTYSIFAKAGELNHIVLIDNDGGGVGINYNLSTGVATQSASVPFDNFDIIPYGNGWFRCIATATNPYFYWVLSDNGGISVTANGTNGIYIYGFQAEANATYATSYIPNHGTSGGVTRAADSCSVTGASDVIGQSEGTIYLDIQTPDAIQSNTTFSIGGGTSSEYAQLEIRTDLSINWRYRQGGTDYINANVGSYSAGDRLKLAFGYKNGDSILYLNGSSIATDTGSIASNSWDEVKYSNFTDTGKLEASVYETILFNERLTNAELATLTTL